MNYISKYGHWVERTKYSNGDLRLDLFSIDNMYYFSLSVQLDGESPSNENSFFIRPDCYGTISEYLVEECYIVETGRTVEHGGEIYHEFELTKTFLYYNVSKNVERDYPEDYRYSE